MAALPSFPTCGGPMAQLLIWLCRLESPGVSSPVALPISRRGRRVGSRWVHLVDVLLYVGLGASD